MHRAKRRATAAYTFWLSLIRFRRTLIWGEKKEAGKVNDKVGAHSGRPGRRKGVQGRSKGTNREEGGAWIEWTEGGTGKGA